MIRALKINAEGLGLIKSFESCRLVAYPDPGTGGDPWTIGWGHTGEDVYEGLHISQDQADELLEQDVESFEKALNRVLKTELSSNQFSALVSFAYNVKGWSSSSLIRYVNQGNLKAAANEFPKWCHAGGRVLNGLVKRRAAEQTLFLKAI